MSTISEVQVINPSPVNSDVLTEAAAASALAAAKQEALFENKISDTAAEIQALLKAGATKRVGAPDADIGNAINMLKAHINLLNVLLQFMAYANDVLNKTRRENMAMDAETTAKLCEKIRETYNAKIDAADKNYHASVASAWISVGMCMGAIGLSAAGASGELMKLKSVNDGIAASKMASSLVSIGAVGMFVGSMASPVGTAVTADQAREAQTTQAVAEAITNMQRLMDQLLSTLKDNERSQKDMLLKINESMINILQRLLDAFSGMH